VLVGLDLGLCRPSYWPLRDLLLLGACGTLVGLELGLWRLSCLLLRDLLLLGICGPVEP
jgi:hypothetical protein